MLFKRLLFVMIAFSPAMSIIAAGNMSQIVVPMKQERNFSWAYHEADNFVTIEFEKTTPKELEAFERYDEKLIKRVIIKDLGSYGSQVKLYLRNRDVRTAVNKFKEPLRIVVDFFDADYQERRDPITGLPLATTEPKPAAAAEGDYKLLEPNGNSSYPAYNTNTSEANASKPTDQGKRKLLQHVPELFVNAQDFNTALAETPRGVGRKWESYPTFMFRLETNDMQLGSNDKITGTSSLNALTSAEAMADFAGRKFDSRDENQAYVAYQQVLHKDSSIFEKDATHLWKFAEIHLGQENLTLARSYYETLIEKHPGSFLTEFAKMRILDIAAYRALQNNQMAVLPTLAGKLDEIRLRNIGELSANVAIRKAFWSNENIQNFAQIDNLPTIGETTRIALEKHLDQSDEGGLVSRTSFLTSAILLNNYTQPTPQWQKSYGLFAAGFFKRFKKGIPADYLPKLTAQLYTKINTSLQNLVRENKLVDALDNYEALPATISSIKKNEVTAFALAEAYRQMGQTGKAADHYKIAAAKSEIGPEKFKAEFWQSVTAGEYKAQLTAEKARVDQINKYDSDSKASDRAAAATWTKLKPDEQKQIAVAYQEPFEDAIKGSARLRTPAKIVLSHWDERLSTKVATGDDLNVQNPAEAKYPPGATVLLLTDLSTRFEQMGMRPEQEKTRALLATIKPAQFKDDKGAKESWTTQLLDQAEKYRKANKNLDAGRLYTLIGTEAENFEGRAEALYKGGLLLYNAGRRGEALEAFKKSSEDGNNLYYSNLAKDRLSQLEE